MMQRRRFGQVEWRNRRSRHAIEVVRRGLVSSLCRYSRAGRLLTVMLAGLAANAATGGSPTPLFQTGDRIVFVGNTFAERLQWFNHFETMLTVELADKDLTFRNLSWSADAIDHRPRPLNFGAMPEHLSHYRADVIVACFGMVESFRRKDGLSDFREELDRYVKDRTSRSFGGNSATRMILVSPIAHERLGGRLPDPVSHNKSLKRYTKAMRQVAKENGISFLNLFEPTRRWYDQHPEKSLTFNGIHLTAFGDWVVAGMMLRQLGFDVASAPMEPDISRHWETLRKTIGKKNEIFFHRWRPVNTEYIYGRRRKPFGIKHFPREMERLEAMTGQMDRKIHDLAKRFPKPNSRPPQPPMKGRLIGSDD